MTRRSSRCLGGCDPHLSRDHDRTAPRVSASVCAESHWWRRACETVYQTKCWWIVWVGGGGVVHACQWPRGTPGPRNYLNGHSCTSIATGCFNGGTLWAGEQGNDRSGRRNALILSQWQEGMLPLSDGLIAPALIDRQPRPLRSPGNTGPPPHPHPRSTSHNHWLAHKSNPISLFLPLMWLILFFERCAVSG